MKLKVERAALVYQASIANVFHLTGPGSILDGNNRRAVRLMQADFAACENYARGLACAGTVVKTYACNKAGNIVDSPWSDNLDEQPFSDKFRPVTST